jgi:hypothetical protein
MNRYNRVLDTVAHRYTGRQMLDRILHMWKESIELPIYVVATRNEALSRINAIRVALAKERKKQHLNAHYGMDTSDVFGWTHESGVKGEAIVIFWRQSRFQQLAHTWDTSIIGKGQ